MPPALWVSLAAHRDAWSGQTSARTEDLRARLAARRSEPGEANAQDRYAAIEAELAAPVRAWNPAVEALGRLNAGITRAQAEAQIRALASHLANEALVTRRPTVRLEAVDQGTADTKTIAAILMIIVGLVLFVACANVTNVLLTSAASRRREIGTRRAIGANRGRILRQLLTQSMLLGVISSIVGFAAAMAVLPSFAALIKSLQEFDVSPDLWVYASLGVMTVLVGIPAGLAPARYGRGQDLTAALKIDQVTAPLSLPRARLHSLLIATQAAVSTVLLVVAALLTRSLIETSALSVGYDLDPLVTIQVGNPTSGSAWDAVRRRAYWDGLLDQVRQIAGVASAALAVAPPFSGDDDGSATRDARPRTRTRRRRRRSSNIRVLARGRALDTAAGSSDGWGRCHFQFQTIERGGVESWLFGGFGQGDPQRGVSGSVTRPLVAKHLGPVENSRYALPDAEHL